MKEKKLLMPGDEIVCEIEKIGTLVNRRLMITAEFDFNYKCLKLFGIVKSHYWPIK